MKVAIIGTRGIPNYYGGFEQLAQYLSLGLKASGHEVTVYSQHNHPYKESVWNGVRIVHCFDPEKSVGTVGQFVYDLNCIVHTRRQKFDAIINLGYTSSSVFMNLLPKGSKVITNMDGLEWKRTKYSPAVQRFLKYAEKLAVKRSHVLVADSVAIQQYLKEKYNVESVFIPYGADIFNDPVPAILEQYRVTPFSYDMLIARMEPENNIEMILDGVASSGDGPPFLVVGSVANQFGKHLLGKFSNNRRIIFTGPIYDASPINNLRYHSRLYFHGHSVGGTNPSLLEAMGCGCLIAAHDNIFNRSVLQESAFYFKSAADVAGRLKAADRNTAQAEQFIRENIERIERIYTWAAVVSAYEALL